MGELTYPVLKPTKETFYVLKHRDSYVSAVDSEGDEPTVQTYHGADAARATRFSSVKAVLTFIQRATRTANKKAVQAGCGLTFLSREFSIVRVEVTPAHSIVTVLDESDVVNTKRPVVLYNVRKKMYLGYDLGGYITYHSEPAKAFVWANLAAFIGFKPPHTSIGLPEEFEVRRVVEQKVPEQITETVLK
jgi:hypothetical protein